MIWKGEYLIIFKLGEIHVSIKEIPTSMNTYKNVNLNKKTIMKLKEFDIVRKKYIRFFLNVKSL